MSHDVSERSFEEAIECTLLQHGPDACVGDATAVHETPPPYGETPPGGYRRRTPEDYDRALCLLPRDAVDFVLATQPKERQLQTTMRQFEQTLGVVESIDTTSRQLKEATAKTFERALSTSGTLAPGCAGSSRRRRSCPARPAPWVDAGARTATSRNGSRRG